MTFWDSFRESVILQGLLTVMLWGVACYMFIVGRSIPDLLAMGCGAVITFWFTSKTTRAVEASVAKAAVMLAAKTPPA
jgi:hypothetical protein